MRGHLYALSLVLRWHLRRWGIAYRRWRDLRRQRRFKRLLTKGPVVVTGSAPLDLVEYLKRSQDAQLKAQHDLYVKMQRGIVPGDVPTPAPPVPHYREPLPRYATGGNGPTRCPTCWSRGVQSEMVQDLTGPYYLCRCKYCGRGWKQNIGFSFHRESHG